MQIYLNNEQVNRKKVQEIVDHSEHKLQKEHNKIISNINSQDK